MFDDVLVLIKGAGDLASGVAARLWRAGFRIVMTELPQPLAIRRTVAFADAIYDETTDVEGIEARRATNMAEIEAAWHDHAIPVVVGTSGALAGLVPTIVVDATIAKYNQGTRIDEAALVIGLGPGFTAGQDCHAVIETNRGHYLGRVIWQGSAQPDTSTPGEIGGQARKRVIYAPTEGTFQHCASIGAKVQEGDIIAIVGKMPVVAPISGVLRGMIHNGIYVTQGLKVGDVDPRCVVDHCFTISEKALAIGGGVLEATLAHLVGKRVAYT